MSDEQSAFPRRDDDGRVTVLADLIGLTLAGLVIGILAVVLFDWLFALLGLGEFGRANGWLAVILPAWVFVEEFRAWAGVGPVRLLAALVAVAAGVATGLLVAGLVGGVPPLASGGLAATAFALCYAVVWFVSIRWLARRTG